MKVKVESEKVGLKLNIQKTKITASGSITSWQIGGETVEAVADFIQGWMKHRLKMDLECQVHESRKKGQQRMRQFIGITDLMDEFEQGLGVHDGQGNLACCSPWGHKELNMTELLEHF